MAAAPLAHRQDPAWICRPPGQVSAFEFGNVAATLLILRASELLAPGRGQDRATHRALGLYVAYNLAATVASIPAGRLGDRRGAVLVLAMNVVASWVRTIADPVQRSRERLARG